MVLISKIHFLNLSKIDFSSKNIEIKFVSFFSNKSKGQKRTKILVTNNQILSVITE